MMFSDSHKPKMHVLVSFLWLFLVVPYIGLQCVVVAFTGQTYLRFSIQVIHFKYTIISKFQLFNKFILNTLVSEIS